VGIFPIAPTPFTESGEIIEGQRRVLDCMIDQGADGICILANYSKDRKLNRTTRLVTKAGVRPGDAIVAVNNTPVKSPEQLKELIAKAGKPVAPMVQRDDARIVIPVAMGWKSLVIPCLAGLRVRLYFLCWIRCVL
jgi:hypothetical protein